MTTFVEDTFTGSDGTQLSAHTGETGATWSMLFSSNAAGLQIRSNKLRMPTTAENGTYDEGEYYAKASGSVDTGEGIVVEFTASTDVNGNVVFNLYQNGDDPGNSDVLVTINGAGSDNVGIRDDGGFTRTTIAFSTGVEYTFRLEVDSAGEGTLYVDDVETLSGLRDEYFLYSDTIAVSMSKDGASAASQGWSIDNLSVISTPPAPPPPTEFFTELVGTTETI